MVQLKQPTTYNQQIERLRLRGCLIPDEPFCAKILSQVNYYRLTAYFLPFKQVDGNYAPGTDFNSVYQIYEFDRKLRNLLFASVEEVEIFLRAKFAYYHAHEYGATGYLNATNYNSRHKHDIFQKRIDAEIKNGEKILFVQHHISNYGGQFPIWVITELFTFGMLSYFYSDLPPPDQKQLARDMFNTTHKNLASWLRCCTDLRNICAHYGRLYFRIFTAVPVNMPELSAGSSRSLFGAVLVLKTLYPDKGKWNGEAHPKLVNLIKSYSQVIKLSHIGFPADWETKLMK